MQLSFIALSVIPELRVTDGGTLDVDGRVRRGAARLRASCRASPFGHLHM